MRALQSHALRPGTGTPWRRYWPTTFSTDDRRRVVGAGIRHGRDAVVAEISATRRRRRHELDVRASLRSAASASSSGVPRLRAATSGPRRSISRSYDVVEIDADERIAARVVFDLDDFDAAIAELDARYLAGEAAAHAHTWSVIAGAYAAINRHELPELTPDWVNIDHRRGAAFATGDMTAYLNDLLDDTPDINVYIEVVHRLSNLGAVITQAAHGTSQQGFDAEWREIGIFTFDGDLLSPLRTVRRGRPRRRDRASSNSSAGRRRGWKTRQAKWLSASRRTSRLATGTPSRKSWPTTFPRTIAVGWWARDSDMVAMP